jgi:hypothetical protein
MKITSEIDDAADFIRNVERVVNGVLGSQCPEMVALIKINNWFGLNWLGFSGKTLGAVGVWHRPAYSANRIRIPPFVPSRVVSQRRFAGPAYVEVPSGKPIHLRVPSSVALLRKAATAEPRTALVWYSGNSRITGRGAVMAYLPIGNSYWAWYAALETGDSWHITKTCGIKPEDLSKLIEQDPDSTRS